MTETARIKDLDKAKRDYADAETAFQAACSVYSMSDYSDAEKSEFDRSVERFDQAVIAFEAAMERFGS